MSPGMAPTLLLVLALASASGCAAYYLPGTYPQEFVLGQVLRGTHARCAPPVYTSGLPRCAGSHDAGPAPRSAARGPSGRAQAPHAVSVLCAADVNSLTSPETELPFDYYSLPFCRPPEGVKAAISSINPGTILTGARIENSPYNFSVMVRVV